ncbi:MAG: hypothetical protein ACYTGF_01030 [Planctomycetota bacterium]|jgi:hypothetical protein
MDAKLFLVAVSTLCVAGVVWAYSEISDVDRSLEDLPQSVVETLQRQPGGSHPTEIEEIRYEGVPVLYEAELDVDGREQDVIIRPNGELVRPGRQGAEGDGDGDGLYERTVTLRDLPKAAADALRAVLDGREAEEIEEIRFENVVVLYEAEVGSAGGHRPMGDEDDGERNAVGELYIYPYGAIATQEGDVIEREVAAADLPKAVADTLQVLRGGNQAGEIDEIRYEGIPILYEAEVGRDGQESEVSVFPDGRLAGHEDADAESEGGIEERELDVGRLPKAVAELVRNLAGGGQIVEAEVVRYEGITVLFEAEIVRDGEEYDLYVYPGGKLAESQRCGGDDEDDDSDDGDSDDGDSDDDDDDD